MKIIYSCSKGKFVGFLKLIVMVLVLVGSGVKVLGQTNNYFGTTGILNGAVWSTAVGGPYTSALNTTGGAIINFGNTTTSITGAAIIVAGIYATANATITTPGGTISNFSNGIIPVDVSGGVILDFNGQGITTSATAGYIKNGSGVFATVGNTYNGGFTLNTGTLIVRGNNTLGTGTATLNGGILAANNARTLGSSNVIIGGDIQIGEIPANVALASNTANMTFPAVALGGTTRTFTFGNAAAYTISGVISGTGGITFASNANGIAGNMTNSGTNTYSGPTTINGGTLIIGAINNGGANGRLGASSNAATNLVLGGGTLSYTGVTSSTDRNFTLTTGTASTINVSTTSTILTLTGAAATSNGSLTKTGSGTLQLSGANAYAGTTAVTAGTLRIGAAERIDNVSPLVLTGGTFGLNSFNETVGSLAGSGGTVDTQGGGTPIFTAGVDNSTTSFAGAISNGTGTVAFTKEGTGTLTLTGANTYTGTTTINAGTLQLSRAGGALAAAQTVSVNSTGTLRITNNQTLANLNLASGATLTVDAGATLNITGTFTVNTGATISTTGTITYGGVGALIYTGTTSFTAGIEWPTSSVPVSVNIGSTATVVLSTNVTTTTSLIVDGILNAKTFQITGTGPIVNINGTLITERLQGFTGAGTTFTGISPILGSTSTVEYSATSGTQIVTTSPLYANLTLSSGGTKTAASALSISNYLTISGTTVFDANNSSIGGAGTNIVMTGTSRYIQAGTGTQPKALGIYTLGSGTTIEFSNTAGTQEDIRLTGVSYYNIDISGTNVGNAGTATGIAMQAGSTFTVKTGGTFNLANTAGFTGTAATAVSNTNSPTIILESNSTINYNGAAQTITNTLGYQNLILSGTGIKTAPTTDLFINGNLSRAGLHTFNANGGGVVFQGTTTQTYSAAVGTSPIDFYNLSSINPQNLIVDSTFGVLNELNLTSTAKLNLNLGDVIMRSSASRTSHIVDLGTTAASTNITYGTGRFSIERYLFAIKSWRYLATPVQTFVNDATTPTITESWREGGTSPLSTGYGTRITGPDFVGPVGALTLDQNTQRPSMKSYNGSGYTGVFQADINAGKRIANDEGYAVFVNGDRGEDAITSSLPSITTLRIRGKIRTGNQTFNLTSAVGGFLSVGNPYASRIDFRNVIRNNINGSFYLWNPSGGAYGVGIYEVYVRDLSTGEYKKNGINPVLNTIESGQAFFIQSSGPGFITIQESDKKSLSSNVSRLGVVIPTLEITLHTNDAIGNEYIADGVMLNFGSNLSAVLDNMDVKKISNSVDNLSIKYATNNLVVERRPNLTNTDTIKLNLTSTRIAPYRFEIDPSVLANTGLEAILKDKYLQTETAVSLSAVTNINFDITADAGSRVADRFMIVFKQAASLSFTTINAERTADKTVTVKWGAQQEVGVTNYEIQRSNDGINFLTLHTQLALGNNGSNPTYTKQDATASKNNIWYRVKALLNNGNVKYSAIAMVGALLDVSVGPSMAVYPNPVEDKLLKIHFIGKTGKYGASLLNAAGKTVYTKNIIVVSENETQTIEANKSFAAGNYSLVLVAEDGSKKVIPIVIL
jgi:autotransporter-associated beta strand protein